MRDIVGAWLIACGLFTLVYATAGELGHRAAARRAKTPRRAIPPAVAVVRYLNGAGPHPKGHAVLWLDTNDQDEALSVIAGGTI